MPATPTSSPISLVSALGRHVWCRAPRAANPIRHSSFVIRHSRRQGFTLLELVLVLVILVVVAGLAVPVFRSFMVGRQTRDAAAQIVTLTRYAHVRAMSDGGIYCLNLDPAAGTFWVSLQDAANQSQPLGSDFGQTHQLPETVRLDADMPFEQGRQIIRFYPNGRTDPGTILLRDVNQAVQIVCQSAAENYSIAGNGGQP